MLRRPIADGLSNAEYNCNKTRGQSSDSHSELHRVAVQGFASAYPTKVSTINDLHQSSPSQELSAFPR